MARRATSIALLIAGVLLGEEARAQGTRVQAVVDVGAPAADGTVPVTVRVVPSAVVLGSYQGALRFTPGSVQLRQVTAPRGGDATRLVNAADSTAGLVRFAGYTVSGFRHDTVLTLRVRATRPLDPAAFIATLEVAADSAGTRIPRERLLPSSGGRPRP